LERCPVCRSRLRGAVVCPRCGADLALPQSISVMAEHALRNALHCIARGELNAARLATEQAQKLRLTPLAQLLPGFLEHLAKPAANSSKTR
jgi:uncharacterized ferritin-like protein (DUF455 family)